MTRSLLLGFDAYIYENTMLDVGHSKRPTMPLVHDGWLLISKRMRDILYVSCPIISISDTMNFIQVEIMSSGYGYVLGIFPVGIDADALMNLYPTDSIAYVETLIRSERAIVLGEHVVVSDNTTERKPIGYANSFRLVSWEWPEPSPCHTNITKRS